MGLIMKEMNEGCGLPFPPRRRRDTQTEKRRERRGEETAWETCEDREDGPTRLTRRGEEDEEEEEDLSFYMM